jgi:hypothetical protein
MTAGEPVVLGSMHRATLVASSGLEHRCKFVLNLARHGARPPDPLLPSVIPRPGGSGGQRGLTRSSP